MHKWTSWTQKFWKQLITISPATSMIYTVKQVKGFKQVKLEKKAFRTKQLELYKTGTKKSSPDMFNFDVILAGHDAGRATTCRRKCKAPCLQTKV